MEIDRKFYTITDFSKYLEISENEVEHLLETEQLQAEYLEIDNAREQLEPAAQDRVIRLVKYHAFTWQVPAGEIIITHEEAERFKRENRISIEKHSSLKNQVTESPNVKEPNDNFFKREGDIWQIQYEGKKKTIKQLMGLQHIAYLLERPGKAVSCIVLSQTTTNPPEVATIKGEQALAEGLAINTSSRLVNNGKDTATKKNLLARYNELSAGLGNVESEFEKRESEAEMNEIMQSLKSEKKIPDTMNAKAQANIKKSIDRAIDAIDQGTMKELAMYLKNNIKSDGMYGYIYNGIPWEIIL